MCPQNTSESIDVVFQKSNDEKKTQENKQPKLVEGMRALNTALIIIISLTNVQEF